MTNPPDLLTAEEEKQLAQIVETNIDFATEQSHVHEVVKLPYLEGTCQVCEAGELVKGICDECGANNDGPV